MAGKTHKFEFNWEFEGLNGMFIIRTVFDSADKRHVKLNRLHPVELVKQNDHGGGYVVAWFTRDSDGGYSLEFVGSRPLYDIEPDEIAAIWAQLKAAQEMLDAYGRASTSCE